MSTDIGGKIKKLRSKQGLTLEQVANIVGVGKSTVAKWENGRITNMKRDKISKLAEALRVSPTYLMGWEDESENTKVFSPVKNKGVEIPILGRIPAGIPLEAIQDISGHITITRHQANKAPHFALKIRGNSMSPQIQDGDTVLVRQQSDVENGQIAVVLVNGSDATCKKIMKSEHGITLLAYNPVYEPTFYSNKEIAELPIEILGVVVESRREYI